jgi:osmotically-inducible protein OsmY
MGLLMKRTDAQIHKDVLAELHWDPRVEETEVGVEVDAGVVTLTGTVDSWAKLMAAVAAAHRVAGVQDVANNLKVKPRGATTPTDTDIAQAVRRALEWDVFVPERDIKSTVSDGQVRLEGTVKSGNQRDAAERAIRNLAGVRSVVNLIAVEPPKIEAGDIRKAIEAALERRAEREARRVRIEVNNGIVALSGTVHSWAERQAVCSAARFTPGVRSVDDRLHVDLTA